MKYVSEGVFREVMAPLTEALSAYAVAASRVPQQNGNRPAASSKAMNELAAENSFGTPDWLEPVRNAHSLGGILSHFLVENISALAAVIGTSRVGPTWAHLAQVRVIVETAPVAYWLLDPSITVQQRIQRGIAYRQDGAKYLCKNKSIPGAAKSGNSELQRFQRYRKATSKLFAGVREAMPASADGFAAIAGGKPNPLHDDALWSYASSTFHGSSWALIEPAIKSAIPNGPFDPTGATLSLHAESGRLSIIGLYCWRGVNAVVGARLALMGWARSTALVESTALLDSMSTALARTAP